MREFDEQLKDHLHKYHLRDLQHDAEIVKLTGQNESLWDDKERLEGKVLALKIGLEQLRGADVSEHVRNHIENVLASVSLGQSEL